MGLAIALHVVPQMLKQWIDPAWSMLALMVIDAAVAACEELGLPFRRMTSGAYHDAMVLAAKVPVGMLFVPSAGGISHHPDEHTDPEDIDRGVDVLAGTLARLAA